MGCFDVVCALTNTPIHHGDKCHLMVLRKNIEWSTLEWIMSSEGKLGVDRVFDGEYNDYGSVENCTPPLTEADEEYLEKLSGHEEDIRKYFFVCDTAWQYAQEKFKDHIPYEVLERRRYREQLVASGGKLSTFWEADTARENHYITMSRLIKAFEYACKHPLSGLGQYHQYGGDVVVGIRENMALTEKRLQEIEERNKEYEAS